MGESDDRTPDTPEGPPDDREISIEFVDHDEPGADDKPPTSEGDMETEPGAPAVEVDRGEASAREKELEDRISKLEDQLLRRRAEFENYKRRQERESEEFRKHAGARAVEDLLPALDNLDRAVESVRAEVSTDHMLGLELVRHQFMDSLGKLGLAEIAALGQPFDPAFHEAVSMVSLPEVPPMTVTSVYQKGFTLGGKLLRPARVVVNSGGAEKAQGEADA